MGAKSQLVTRPVVANLLQVTSKKHLTPNSSIIPLFKILKYYLYAPFFHRRTPYSWTQSAFLRWLVFYFSLLLRTSWSGGLMPSFFILRNSVVLCIFSSFAVASRFHSFFIKIDVMNRFSTSARLDAFSIFFNRGRSDSGK